MVNLVIGAGQGGCRLAKQFSETYEVEGRYMNLTRVDFSKLQVPRNHILLFRYGGTGRDPQIGEAMVRKNADALHPFLAEALESNKARRVALCVGGGGGSGVGFMFPTLEYLLEKGVQVLLLYTMPLRAEGMPAGPNALIALNRLIDKYIGHGLAKDKQVAPLLIDNEFCISRYGIMGSTANYWQRVNKGVVYSLKRFYNLVDLEHFKNYVDATSGFNALDYREFLKILFFKEGFLDIREVQFEEPQIGALGKTLKTSSLVFGSLDIRTCKAYIVSLAIPELWRSRNDIVAFTEDVFDSVARSTKTPFSLKSSYFNSRIVNARLSILAAGMNKSHGLDKILKQAASDVEKFKAKGDVETFDVSGLEY